MTDKSLFEYSSYKPYVRAILGGPNKKTGRRAQAARAIGCQSAYLSQVLNGAANLSLEQAHSLSVFLNHDLEEQEFFWLLVQRERSGTRTFRTFIDEKISHALEKRSAIKNRLKIEEELSKEDQTTYYSHHLYAAIHVMVSVPGLDTKVALAQHLGLPMKQVSGVVDFLESRQLIVMHEGRYRMGTRHLHLAHDSPHIARHHTNWRLRSLMAIDAPRSADDLHYSVVVSLSREDLRRLRENLLATIQDNMKIVKDSPEECVIATTIDFFEV